MPLIILMLFAQSIIHGSLSFFSRINAISIPVLLGITLMALVGNVLLNRHFTESITQQMATVSSLEQQKSQNQLQADWNTTNERFYEGLTNLNKSQFAQQLEDVARSVPSTIAIQSFRIYPQKKKKGKEKEAHKKDTIYITGNAKNIDSVSELKSNLLGLGWIQKVEIQNLVHDRKSGLHTFNLTLTTPMIKFIQRQSTKTQCFALFAGIGTAVDCTLVLLLVTNLGIVREEQRA